MKNIIVLFMVLFLNCNDRIGKIEGIDIVYNQKPASYEDPKASIFFVLKGSLNMNIHESQSLKMKKYSSFLKSGKIKIDDDFYIQSIDTINKSLIIKGYSYFNPNPSSITLNDYYEKSKKFFLDGFSLTIVDGDDNLYEFVGVEKKLNYVFNKKKIDSSKYNLIRKYSYGNSPVGIGSKKHQMD